MSRRSFAAVAGAGRGALWISFTFSLLLLTPRAHARKDPGRVWDRTRDDDLKDLLHRRPREFGKPTSLWTLALVAEVCHDRGWTPRKLSIEAIRHVLIRLGIGWKRAKHGITSPDPEYAAKRSCGIG